MFDQHRNEGASAAGQRQPEEQVGVMAAPPAVDERAGHQFRRFGGHQRHDIRRKPFPQESRRRGGPSQQELDEMIVEGAGLGHGG